MASILVVDDDDDLRDFIAELLGSHGHHVRACHGGLEAMRALDDGLPQLVISDVEMPDLGGPALVYAMFVADLGRENIPVILISGGADVAKIAAQVGTPYFLAKPFLMSALFALVERALSEARPPKPSPHRANCA